MGWLIPRIAAVLFAAAAGAAVAGRGSMSGPSHATLGAAIGVALAAALLVLLDGMRLARFSRWLRGGEAVVPPQDAGVWGEIAYRIERGYSTRDEATRRVSGQLSQLLTAIEASPNGVLLLDAHDQIEWCSAVAADHLGLDPARDVRQPVTNLVRAPAFVAHLQSGAFAESMKFPSPTGRGVVSVVVRPYGDGLTLVLTQDVTERERADAMRRDFVANVSHEIRTPLTVLAGFVETMSTLPLSEAERHRVLALMRQQTSRMQSLVADLLTLAKIEGSPRPPADRWITVASVMRQVEAEVAPLSGGRHSLGFFEADPAMVAGSESELVSALANLVGNAVRYTPEGGRIDVAWRPRVDGGGEFEVRDTGIGIAEEHLPRLTERFYRVDGSRSRDTGGTGLGLSIVKHIVQRHGGELAIESDVGKGSSFRLLLPAFRVRTGPRGEGAEPPSA